MTVVAALNNQQQNERSGDSDDEGNKVRDIVVTSNKQTEEMQKQVMSEWQEWESSSWWDFAATQQENEGISLTEVSEALWGGSCKQLSLGMYHLEGSKTVDAMGVRGLGGILYVVIL